MLTIEDKQETKSFALFNLGFRPFFLLAGIYAVTAMLIWMIIYLFNINPLPTSLPPMLWHGHEMVFGFSIAVISGFLLAAIGNWTNRKTIQGFPLMALCLVWIIARILPFSGLNSALPLTAISDSLFMIGLIIAISHPILKARQWMQLPIVLVVFLMFSANLLYYLGLLKILPPITTSWGLYSGLYLIIALILIMGRRVIPFFIEKGVDEEATIKNWKWLDISSLVLLLMFIISEVFLNKPTLSEPLAGLLFILHCVRLWGWFTKGIWKKPLLWVLYIGYSFIVLGFFLKAVSSWLLLSPWIPLHAFATGGIGIVTTGMMSRVALGHTGRNVFSPPSILSTLFILLIIGAILRVLFPIMFPSFHIWWIASSQVLWILGFSLFVYTYAPMLVKARIDGRFG